MKRATSLQILHPKGGDILNRHDGAETSDSLTIQVSGSAPPGARVTVNGLPAQVAGESFTCQLALSMRKSIITARARWDGGSAQREVTVLWDRGSRPRYRFSVDDNIEFLRDLGSDPERYPSLFDHWYLGFWRRMHEEFGAKVHLNLYYQTITRDFTLAQMPGKWREEWKANSHWLHLTFHALQDKPDRIYRRASYRQMAGDFDLVVGEIRRFAGDSVLSKATTIHFAEAPREACRALHDRGIRVLIGIFRRESRRQCTTGYFLSPEAKDYADTRDYLYDLESDLIFITEDATVNALAPDEIGPWLERQAASPHTGELIELLIHEQYFRPELHYYQPEVQEKVMAALRWVTTHGYRPVFWGDGFLGSGDEV